MIHDQTWDGWIVICLACGREPWQARVVAGTGDPCDHCGTRTNRRRRYQGKPHFCSRRCGQNAYNKRKREARSA